MANCGDGGGDGVGGARGGDGGGATACCGCVVVMVGGLQWLTLKFFRGTSILQWMVVCDVAVAVCL